MKPAIDNNPEGMNDERIGAWIRAEVAEAMRRHPNDAFAVEAQRRLAARKKAFAWNGAPFRARFALPLAATLLVAGSVAIFLNHGWRFHPPAPMTFGQQLATIEMEYPIRSLALPPGAPPLACGLQRMMDAAAAADGGLRVVLPDPKQTKNSGGVSEMLRSGAVYRFMQTHATITQEG